VKLGADVYCLQEIKAEWEQLDEDKRELGGYTAIFNSSRARKGYSGTAVYSKTPPNEVSLGIGGEKFDVEGRTIFTHYEDFILANVYFPNGGMGPERLHYKLDFYDAFLAYVQKLRVEYDKGIVICGDVNTAHKEIDLARPKENEENTGFLPEERAWIDELLAAGFVDAYRHLNPDRASAYSYWDLKTRARDRNVGWRIDYFFVSSDLLPHLVAAEIHADIYGSDHCPVSVILTDIR